ncbi:MAG: helix-turn-helix domain-containing protein [Sulfitobacter sp.]
MNQHYDDIQVLTLPQLSGGQDWKVQLAHDRPHHLLIWITRGQGRVLLDGQRRGLGMHNALLIPAGALFALDLGRQGMGQVVVIPQGTPLRLPEIPRHLRIRDVHVQSELSALIEAAQREQHPPRPLRQDALEAHTALMSVWLRRQIMLEEHVPSRRNAAARLSARFCAMVSARYLSGAPMAEYAAELSVTPTHLTRAVKASTGKTAADILTERVLYAARSLLSETRRPAQDIARHLGFGSAAYFTRFIQQHTGHPPSKLRAK